MKKYLPIGILISLAAIMAGCISTTAARKANVVNPSTIIKPNEPLAVMPFEAESALSNLGGQVSDEVIVNLMEYQSNLKIIPATTVRNYMLSSNLGITGIPDVHSMQKIKEALQCRYLLTGNLYTSIGEVRYTSTYTNRIASGSVTVRLVDCDSTFVVWAKRVEATYSTTTYYYNDGQQQIQSIYVTDGQLLQGLIKKLGAEVARSFYER